MNIRKTAPIVFFIIICSFIILSCNNDDNITTTSNEFKIDNYHGFYAQYGLLSLSSNPFGGDNLIKFEYDNQNRITKRIGDIIYISQNAGGGGYLHDSLYTDVTYASNKITLEKKIAPFGGMTDIQDHMSSITLDGNNRMIKKITSKEVYNGVEIDTIEYSYSNNKIIEYLKTNYVDMGSFNIRYFERSYLHYSNNNLDSIVTIKSKKVSDEQYTELLKKETEIFSGYDSSSNPFKLLSIFEETFNRSLSENNFTQYQKTSNDYNYPLAFDSNFNTYLPDLSQTPTLGQTTNEGSQTWSLLYDNNGNWLYNQF